MGGCILLEDTALALALLAGNNNNAIFCRFVDDAGINSVCVRHRYRMDHLHFDDNGGKSPFEFADSNQRFWDVDGQLKTAANLCPQMQRQIMQQCVSILLGDDIVNDVIMAVHAWLST